MGLVSGGTCQVASSRVVLVLMTFGFSTTCCGGIVLIDEQVEGVVVEVELRTISCRHRTPSLQSTVVRTTLIVVTTIVIMDWISFRINGGFTRAVVSLDKIGLKFVTQGSQGYQLLFLFI